MTNEYLARLSEQLKSKGSSEKTISVYSYFIKKYLDYLNNQSLSIENQTQDDLKKFLQDFENKYSFKSKSLSLSALKFFYSNILNKPSVIQGIESPKKTEAVALSKEEVKKLIDSGQTKKSKLILSLLSSTGIKVSELVNIKTSDLDIPNSLLTVKNKTSSRQIVLPEKLCKEIEVYIQKSAPLIFLFSRTEKPITSRNIQKILKTTAKKADFSKKITPHTLRHSFAIHLLESGIDTKKIQTLLGYRQTDAP